MIGIYKWTNKINNKSYIGQSINIETRRRRHISDSYYPKSKAYNTAFHSAIREYGSDNFDFEVLCICKQEELDTLETFYIKKFNTIVPNGYNMTSGGESRKYQSLFSDADIREIIKELKETIDSADEIAERWGCSASLIKKISYGEQYRLEDEEYPIRDQNHIHQIRQKYSYFNGDTNPSAKLSIAIVEDIVKDLLSTDWKLQEIANKYNISVDQISRINNGKIWKQVERPVPCRDYKKENEQKALIVADLLLNTKMSNQEIMDASGYKDRHTISRINQHQIYADLLKKYPNPIR